MQDGGYASEDAGGWRERFLRADRMAAGVSADARRTRGREFEQVLGGMLADAGLAPRIRFRPVGEEIDGSFFHRGRVLLLEANWTQDPLPASSVYQFRGKIEGKLTGTIGVFISMGGFSADAIDALVAGKVINTVLFDGDDIRAVAAGQVDFPGALDLKLRAAAESGTPYLPLRDPVSERPYDLTPLAGEPGPTMIVVEGAFDVLLVHALADDLGGAALSAVVVPAGGAFNLVAAASAIRVASRSRRTVIIADGDGQPETVRHRIETGLDATGVAGETDILIFDPTLEDALGIIDGSAAGRRRLRSDPGLLRDTLRAAGIRQRAESSPELARLLQALREG